MELIREWWVVVVGGAGMFASYVAGKERTRWEIHQIGDLVARLERTMGDRIAHLERLNQTLADAHAKQAIAMAEMAVEMKHLKEAVQQ